MKCYSLVGKQLKECGPEDLLEKPLGLIVDEAEEIIRLVITKDARPKQRELLVRLSSDFNKEEYAGVLLVSHLENPDLIKDFLKDIKKQTAAEEEPPEKPKKEASKKKKQAAKEEADTVDEEGLEEVGPKILQRWDPELVKKLVNYLDGKKMALLKEIMDHLETTEGEAYWLTQDLIYSGILPGRWIGYSNGEWVYQIIHDQPLSKKTDASSKKKKTKKSKKAFSKKKSKK
ncbi:MAG: hypothetical protein U9O98_07160 [Asgard group archaeon]|nr:hypothetical protein [Asgard group archaeon]